MVENHKKIVLTVKQELELLEKLENGESAVQLAIDWGRN
jgi:hypothetical protein